MATYMYQQGPTGAYQPSCGPGGCSPALASGPWPGRVAPPPRALGAGSNIHELLKAQEFSSNSAACATHSELNKPCVNEPYGTSDQYLVADSALIQGPSQANQGRFVFNVFAQGATGEGHIGVRQQLEQVVEIETFPFCVGVPPVVNPDAGAIPGVITTAANAGADDPRNSDPVTGTASQLAFCERVTLEIVEIGGQSFSDYNQRVHTFEYTAEAVGQPGSAGARVLLTPVNSRYVFTQPLQKLDSLTLQFNNPDVPLSLPIDTIDSVTLATNGASQLVINAPSRLQSGTEVDFTTAPLLVPGDRIFLTGVNLTSATPNFRDIQTYLSNPNGLFVGTPIASQVVSLDPIPTLPTVGANQQIPSSTPIRLLIAKNRVRAPFRIQGLMPRTTNYKLPVTQ